MVNVIHDTDIGRGLEIENEGTPTAKLVTVQRILAAGAPIAPPTATQPHFYQRTDAPYSLYTWEPTTNSWVLLMNEQDVEDKVINMVNSGDLLSADNNNLLELGSDNLLYSGTPGAQGFAMDVVGTIVHPIAVSHSTPTLLSVDPGTVPGYINGLQWVGGSTLMAERAGYYNVTVAFGEVAGTNNGDVYNKFGWYRRNGGPLVEVWRSGSIQGGTNADFGPGGGFSYPVLMAVGDTVQTFIDYRMKGGTGTATISVNRYSAVLVQDLGT